MKQLFQYRLKTAEEIGSKRPSPVTEQYGGCIVHPTLSEFDGQKMWLLEGLCNAEKIWVPLDHIQKVPRKG